MEKRALEVVILSDLHLGTRGCQADELLFYLESIDPETLILNGDVIDFWQFRKSFFPKTHIQILRRLLKMAEDGAKIYYLTGNHDDVLRKFGANSFGQIELRDHLIFQLHGQKHWVFHGDIFDGSVHRARWLAKLGGEGYEFLIRINRWVNRARAFFGLSKSSFSARIKQKVKRGAAKMIGDFEQTAIDLAKKQGFDVVACGHVHRPTVRRDGSVLYLNSGDWVENCTALEMKNGAWSLFRYHPADFELVNPKLRVREKAAETAEVFSFETLGLAAFSSLTKG